MTQISSQIPEFKADWWLQTAIYGIALTLMFYPKTWFYEVINTGTRLTWAQFHNTEAMLLHFGLLMAWTIAVSMVFAFLLARILEHFLWGYVGLLRFICRRIGR